MFAKKTIRVVIYNENYKPMYSFNGLAIEVRINRATLPAGLSANINIYGISKEKMSAITTVVWKTGIVAYRPIKVFANDGDGEHEIFVGQVMSAFPDYGKAPDICISITACAGAYENLVTDVPPSSIVEGSQASVRQFFDEICKSYKMTLVNNGVDENLKCSFPRSQGTGLLRRLVNASKAYNINVSVEGSNVYIWPKEEKAVVKKSEKVITKSDYIGYPSFSTSGIDIKLDKALWSLKLGSCFTLKGSDIAAANDKWIVNKITYNISTKIGGRWEMGISASRIGV